MTPENLKILLDRGIPQAFANGKTIQHRIKDGNTWKDMPDPSFSSDADCYRVKPETADRPFNSEELQDLVGRVIEYGQVRRLVTDFEPGQGNAGQVKLGGRWHTAEYLFEHDFTLNGGRCAVSVEATE